uniref:Uncharacterized protein n=1 Tax=Oryza brachyantha TaxID=4533 RepID=J3LMP3_ORYBR
SVFFFVGMSSVLEKILPLCLCSRKKMNFTLFFLRCHINIYGYTFEALNVV